MRNKPPSKRSSEMLILEAVYDMGENDEEDVDDEEDDDDQFVSKTNNHVPFRGDREFFSKF